MTENSAESSMPQVKRSGSKRPASADQERLVRRYLSALETAKPGRGVKRAADAVGNRITKVDELLVSADPLRRVHLIQERIELHAEHVRLTNGNHTELPQLERDFVRVVRSYGDRNGLTYAAWRQVGVEAKVLEQAGIRRSEKKPPPAVIRAAEKEAAGKAASDKPGADAAETSKAEIDTSAPDKEATSNGEPDKAVTDEGATSDGEPDRAGTDKAGTDKAGADKAGADKAGAGVPDAAQGAKGGPGGEGVAGKSVDENAGKVAPQSSDARNGSAKPPQPPKAGTAGATSEEVSLDELADLLAAAEPAHDTALRQGSDQPSLGDGFETSSRATDQASADRSRPSPRGSAS